MVAAAAIQVEYGISHLALISSGRLKFDYNGRIEESNIKAIKKGQRLKKILIRDKSENVIEMASWLKKQQLLPQPIKNGVFWAITSILVTTYLTTLQMESIPTTTIDINPTTPDTIVYAERLRRMPKGSTAPVKNICPIAEAMILRHVRQMRTKNAKKTGPTGRNVCADDEGKPKFQYCVNATIKDGTGEVDVVFFDEAMTEMIGISCNDMITQHGEDDPYEIPQKILKATNNPKIMSLTMKDDDGLQSVTS